MNTNYIELKRKIKEILDGISCENVRNNELYQNDGMVTFYNQGTTDFLKTLESVLETKPNIRQLRKFLLTSKTDKNIQYNSDYYDGVRDTIDEILDFVDEYYE